MATATTDQETVQEKLLRERWEAEQATTQQSPTSPPPQDPVLVSSEESEEEEESDGSVWTPSQVPLNQPAPSMRQVMDAVQACDELVGRSMALAEHMEHILNTFVEVARPIVMAHQHFVQALARSGVSSRKSPDEGCTCPNCTAKREEEDRRREHRRKRRADVNEF